MANKKRIDPKLPIAPSADGPISDVFGGWTIRTVWAWLMRPDSFGDRLVRRLNELFLEMPSGDIAIYDEGVFIGFANGVNLVGPTVVASLSSDTAIITIDSSTAIAGIVLKEEGVTVGTVTSLDIVGAISTATAIGAAGTITFKNSWIVVTVSYAATITVNLAAYSSYAWVILDLTMTGNVTSFDLSNGADGQVIKLRLREDGTGGRTFVTGTSIRYSADIPSFTIVSTASKLNYIGFEWNTTDSKADVLAYNMGF